jgi:hypothetical protein
MAQSSEVILAKEMEPNFSHLLAYYKNTATTDKFLLGKYVCLKVCKEMGTFCFA